MKRTLKMLWPLALVLSLVTLGACSEDDSGDDTTEEHDEEQELLEEGCTHMEDGPSFAVTATADAASAQPGAAEHMRADVTLIGDAGQLGGFVSVEVDEDSEFVLFLSHDVPVKVLDAQGAEVEVEATEAVDLCSAVELAHTMDLEVGLYTLEFGPTDQATVSVVFEAAGEHDHEGEE
jgi:hypothetical protein